jgi:hypothetical protein
LGHAFSWDKTLEGYKYWDEIFESKTNILTQPTYENNTELNIPTSKLKGNVITF